MLKDKVKVKEETKARIRRRIRKTVRGTAERPRVFVFKSNRYIYTQAVNDDDGRVLASACTLEKAFREANKNIKNTGTAARNWARSWPSGSRRRTSRRSFSTGASIPITAGSRRWPRP